jgi:Transposase DDE domain
VAGRAAVPPTPKETPRRLDRFSIPEQLPGATRFSDEPDLCSVKQLIALVKSSAWLWKPLMEQTEDHYEWVPKRGPGKWALVYFAYAVSHYCDFEPWFNYQSREDVTLWKLCGFTHVPSYQLIWERFTELEKHADAFERAAATLIGHARAKDPRVGAWWHVDSTEAETHAAPQHDCLPHEPCPNRRRGYLPRLDTETVRTLRQAGDEAPVDEPDGEIEREGVRPEPIVKRVVDHERGGVRFLSGGHWWFSRDPDAGTRAYTKGGRAKRAWHGYYHSKVTDHFTGGPLTMMLVPADMQEHSAYPTIYERARLNVGADPLAVAGDRGYSTAVVFEHNTRRGVASVFPYRRRSRNSPKAAEATSEWDEYGVPFCRHCRSGADFIRFATGDHRAPRLWFACSMPQSDGCEKLQTISCAKDYTRLLPLWRTADAYAAMRETHGEYERVHAFQRTRYRVGPDTLSTRPKRIGIGCQQLRSSAALFLEWLRICLRQGWVGRNGRRAAGHPTRPRGMSASIARRRRHLGRSGGGRVSERTRAKSRGHPPPTADDRPF